MSKQFFKLMTAGILSTALFLGGVPSVYAVDVESNDAQDDEVAFTLSERDKHLLLHADELEVHPEGASRGEIERTAHSNASAQGVTSRSASSSRGGGTKGKK